MTQQWQPQSGEPYGRMESWTGPQVPMGPTLVTIGDIACTQEEVITPSGRQPIGSVTWTFTDMSQTTTAIPTWAIVLTVVFFLFCFLGLLFLLVKESRTTGWVQVTVQGNRFLHQVQLPVMSMTQVADYNARVSYARALSVAAA